MHLFIVFFIIHQLYYFVSCQNNNNHNDKHENCDLWASHNECEANPNYMLVHGPIACSKYQADEFIETTIDDSDKIIDGDDVVNDVQVQSIDNELFYNATNKVLPLKIIQTLNGFVLTNAQVFQIKNNFDIFTNIQTLQFISSGHLKSSLKGSTVFELKHDLTNNNRPVWFNGVEYLYHMSTKDDG